MTKLSESKEKLTKNHYYTMIIRACAMAKVTSLSYLQIQKWS